MWEIFDLNNPMRKLINIVENSTDPLHWTDSEQSVIEHIENSRDYGDLKQTLECLRVWGGVGFSQNIVDAAISKNMAIIRDLIYDFKIQITVGSLKKALTEHPGNAFWSLYFTPNFHIDKMPLLLKWTWAKHFIENFSKEMEVLIQGRVKNANSWHELLPVQQRDLKTMIGTLKEPKIAQYFHEKIGYPVDLMESTNSSDFNETQFLSDFKKGLFSPAVAIKRISQHPHAFSFNIFKEIIDKMNGYGVDTFNDFHLNLSKSMLEYYMMTYPLNAVISNFDFSSLSMLLKWTWVRAIIDVSNRPGGSMSNWSPTVLNLLKQKVLDINDPKITEYFYNHCDV